MSSSSSGSFYSSNQTHLPSISSLNTLNKIVANIIPKVHSIYFHKCDGTPNFAHINCFRETDAQKLINELNGKVCSSLRVTAKLQKPRGKAVPNTSIGHNNDTAPGPSNDSL